MMNQREESSRGSRYLEMTNVHGGKRNESGTRKWCCHASQREGEYCIQFPGKEREVKRCCFLDLGLDKRHTRSL